MVWSRLLTSFDPDEETANFGTRFAFESQEKLFDVVTQATITGDSVQSFPGSIQSESSSLNLHLSLDSSLHIVRESNPLSFKLSADLTFILESPCSNFLLVGHQNEIRLLHLPSGSFIPPISIHSASQLIGAAFEGDSILLFNDTSTLIQIRNIHLHLIHESLVASDINALKRLHAELSVEKPIALHQRYTGSIHGSYFFNEKTISRINLENLSSIQSKVATLADIKIGAVRVPMLNPSMIFVLDRDTGFLYVVCALTLVTLKSWTNEPLDDIVLLEESSDEAELKLILVTRNNTLQIREFPSFELVYELKVHSFCRLMQTCLNQETPYFLEGSEKGSDLCLRLRGIVEASPEARLNRLLRRNKFDEALSFVKTFRLDTEEVYKAKTLWLIERLSPWRRSPTTPEETENNFVDLKHCMSEIKDKDFVVQSCIKAALPTIKYTKAILIHAREMIRSNLNELPIDLLVFVSQTLQRIDTFRLVGGKDVEEWINFVDAKPYEIMLAYIKRKQLFEAKQIWIRHLAEFTTMFDSESIMEILEEFRCYDDEAILEWCDIFVPDSLKLVPESLPMISDWAYSVVLSMESRRNRGWPSSGLAFAQKILQNMTFVNSDDESNTEAQLVLFQQRSNYSSSLNQFIKLIDVLKDLITLHNNYRLKIKLENFLESNKSKVVQILLDWTSPDEIQSLLHGYLNEYLRRGSNGESNVSEIYEHYLLDLIENTSATWHWNAGAAPWEEKVSALIPFILSIEKKALVIFKSLKSAPVPWSKVMTDLCAFGSKLPNSSYSVAIREQETLVSLKQILKRYNFRSDEKPNRVQAEKMMKIILKKSVGSREGYKDIVEIASVMPFLKEQDATLAYIRYILQNNSECPMKEITDLVTPKNREFLCRRVLSYATVFTRYSNTNDSTDKELRNYLSFLAFSIDETIPFSIKKEFEVLKKKLEVSKKVAIPSNCPEELQICHIVSSRSMSASELVRQARWIASSLYLNESRLVISLIEDMIKNSSLEDVNSLLGQMSHRSLSSDLNSFLKLIIDSLDVTLPNNLELIKNFARLVSATMEYCDSSILDLCEVSIWLRIILSIFHTPNKNYHYNIHSSLYRDKGLPVALNGMKSFIQTMRLLFPFESVYSTLYKPINILFQTQESPNKPSDETVILFDDNLKTKQSLEALKYDKTIEDLQILMESSVNESKRNAQSLLSLIVFMSYRINFHLLNTLLTSKVHIKTSSSTQTTIIASVFKKILGERKKELDLSLALTCLVNEDSDSSMNILSDNNSTFTLDFSRCTALARIGYNYSNLLSLTSIINKYKVYLQSVLWGKRLVDLGVNAKDALIHSAQDAERVLSKLIKVDSVTIADLLNFALAFNLQSDEVLVLYAEEQLSRNSSALVNQMQLIIKSISNSSTASTMLYKMWDTASSYNYEALRFIIRGLQAKASPNAAISKADEILEFLKHYDRVNGPSEMERNIWMEKHKSDFKKFPEESARKRLPLTPLVTLTKKEKYSLLEKEFQLSNYEVWVGVAHVLNFNSDNILIKAIENAIEDILRSSDLSSGHISIEANYEKLLDKIYECLNSMENFFKATSCAYWILNKLPRGKDKVNASKKYRMIAEKWREAAKGTEEEARSISALEFATDDQLRVETEFVLIKYGLSDQHYLDLVNKKAIETLILNLYEHDSIIERSKTAGGCYPDINGAVEEIGKIQNVQLMSLKFDLLSNWLPENKDLNYLDESLSLDMHQNYRTKDLNDEKDKNNYIRCVYISQCFELHHFLMNVVLVKPDSLNSVHSTSHRLRALRCLLSVVDEKDLSDLTSMDYRELQDLYSNLVFVHKLEVLGLHYDIETYRSCDKKVLIESLIRSSGVSKEGLSLIIDLSIFFSIYDSILWNDLLGRLVQYSSSRLENVILKLNYQPHLWHLENFSKAWNHLLLQPFISNESHEECNKAIDLLNKCPLDLNIDELKGECIRLNYNDLADKLTSIYF